MIEIEPVAFSITSHERARKSKTYYASRGDCAKHECVTRAKNSPNIST